MYSCVWGLSKPRATGHGLGAVAAAAAAAATTAATAAWHLCRIGGRGVPLVNVQIHATQMHWPLQLPAHLSWSVHFPSEDAAVPMAAEVAGAQADWGFLGLSPLSLSIKQFLDFKRENT